MKNTFKLFFTFILMFSFITLVGCDNETTPNSNITPEVSQIMITDYNLPENFFMVLQLSDTSIFDKGDPWYYKTAKIGNDWQLIEYDRDLEDRTKQVTHFFEYLSDDSYQHYTYNYTEQDWEKADVVSFQGMMFTSLNNFKFLYKKPVEVQYHIVETLAAYDCDPTSIESLREAMMYEYADGLDIEIIVDKEYLNITLSETHRNGSLICVSWRAYEFNLTISNWNSSFLAYKNFKETPQ